MATEYVVLMALPESSGDQPAAVPFVPLPGTVTAANDVAAIKLKAKEDGCDLSAGAVAVPLRNWRVRSPERKVQETTLWR